MNQLSLRNNRLKFKTSGELPIVLEEYVEEYTLNEWKQHRKMSTCNRLDLESLGSWPTLPNRLEQSKSPRMEYKCAWWGISLWSKLFRKSVVILRMEWRKSIIKGSFQWWTIGINFWNIKKKWTTLSYIDVRCLFTTFYACLHEHEDNEGDLGSLDTRAKSRDHVIVRDQKKCPKAVPRRFQNHVVWSWPLKCSVKSCVIGSSTKCYFNEILFTMGSSHMLK